MSEKCPQNILKQKLKNPPEPDTGENVLEGIGKNLVRAKMSQKDLAGRPLQAKPPPIGSGIVGEGLAVVEVTMSVQDRATFCPKSALGRPWAVIGPTLGRSWGDLGPTVG